MRTLNPLGGLQRIARIVLLFSKYSVYRLSGVEQSPYSAEMGMVSSNASAAAPLLIGQKAQGIRLR
jgi:hypothetical protein